MSRVLPTFNQEQKVMRIMRKLLYDWIEFEIGITPGHAIQIN